MRVAPCIVGVVCVSLALAGCSLFGKKSSNARGGGSGERAPYSANNRQDTAPVYDRNPTPGVLGGILAGQVIDSYNRKPPATFIQVTESGNKSGAPLDVAADSNGYFTIQGLQSGRQYQLIARARSGDRLLAGTILVTAPNPRILIRISEDNASANTPPIPPPPGTSAPKNSMPGPQAPAPSWPEPAAAGAQNWGPQNAIPDPAQNRPAGLGPPVGLQTPQADPAPPIRPEDIVVKENPRPDPIIRVPNPSLPPVAAGPMLTDQNSNGPARVPSCVLTGQTLYNLALNDLNGNPWEFRNRRGRVVLLDFWGTWCLPCMDAMTHLKILDERYRGYGLEIVGIGYDYESAAPVDRVRNISRICRRKAVNYRILVGGDLSNCPVKGQFRVNYWPTLFLLDQQGRILARFEGLQPQQLNKLEWMIQHELGMR